MTGTFIPDFEITGLTPDGISFGMYGPVQVFVEKGIPGDVADIRMVKSFAKNKLLARGSILSLKKKSPLRIDPFCRHFAYCGGCQWQNISYADQLRFKQSRLEELFSRFNSMSFELLPILPSPKTRHFRNRVTFTYSNRRWMSPEELKDKNVVRQPAGGFVVKGINDRIMNIEECFLADEFAILVMKALREYAIAQGFRFYDVRQEKGFLRWLSIRFGDRNDVMAYVGFGHEDKEKIDLTMSFLAEQFPQLTSLFYAIRPFQDGLRSGETYSHFAGKEFIEYQMENLVFRTGPASFFQTNTQQALTLYRTAREFAALTGMETVYDLYTGTGTIALFVSRLAKKVVGVDQSEAAINDAQNNASLNGIENTAFFSGDLKNTLHEDFFSTQGSPDVIITDPPRSGMHREGISRLRNSGARRIVYISCNPFTQARDLHYLSSHYRIVKMQPVDMFPQTGHLENVALLEILS